MPEGGCKEICDKRLDCGHTCASFCHYFIITEEDKTGHNNYRCKKDCERETLPCGHKCKFKCYECKNGCKPCVTKVLKKFDSCGHEYEVNCSDYNTAKCNKPCEKMLDCGH